MTEAQKYDVYIAFSQEDSRFAHKLAEELSSLTGLRVFDAKGAYPSESPQIDAKNGRENSTILVALLSPKAIHSTYFIEDVVEFLAGQKPVIPVITQPMDYSALGRTKLEMLLKIAYLDLSRGGYQENLRLLIEAIQTGLRGSESGSPSQASQAQQTANPEVPASDFGQSSFSLPNDPDTNLSSGRYFDPKDFTTRTITSADGGFDVETSYQGKPVASSTIKLDGNVSVVVPMRTNASGAQEVDPFVYELHQKNVQAAIYARTQELSSQASKSGEAAKAEEPKPDLLQAAIEANRLVNNRSQAVFNDRAQGEDQLGIKDEVEALAETLLLRDANGYRAGCPGGCAPPRGQSKPNGSEHCSPGRSICRRAAQTNSPGSLKNIRQTSPPQRLSRVKGRINSASLRFERLTCPPLISSVPSRLLAIQSTGRMACELPPKRKRMRFQGLIPKKIK